MPRLIIALVVIAAILYFTIEPGTGRQTAEQVRTTVRESVHNSAVRLNDSVDAAKKDVNTIKARVEEGGRNAREQQSHRP